MLINQQTIKECNCKDLVENFKSINNAYKLIKLYIDLKSKDKNYQEIIKFLRNLI